MRRGGLAGPTSGPSPQQTGHGAATFSFIPHRTLPSGLPASASASSSAGHPHLTHTMVAPMRRASLVFGLFGLFAFVSVLAACGSDSDEASITSTTSTTSTTSAVVRDDPEKKSDVPIDLDGCGRYSLIKAIYKSRKRIVTGDSSIKTMADTDLAGAIENLVEQPFAAGEVGDALDTLSQVRFQAGTGPSVEDQDAALVALKDAWGKPCAEFGFK